MLLGLTNSKISEFFNELRCGTVLVRKLNDLSWANQALECFLYFSKVVKIEKILFQCKNHF